MAGEMDKATAIREGFWNDAEYVRDTFREICEHPYLDDSMAVDNIEEFLASKKSSDE